MLAERLFMMAGVLEKRERRTYLDDTTPLTVTIVTNRMRDSYVVSSTESTTWCIAVELCTYALRCTSCTGCFYDFSPSVYLQEYVIKVHRGPNPEEGWEVSLHSLKTCIHD